MSKIPFTISNVAQTSVSEINADATARTGGAGNRMVFGGITVAQKGAPFQILRVNESNKAALLGKDYHSSNGVYADSMRALSEALKGGEGIVVRVVPSTATYPFIRVKGASSVLVASAEETPKTKAKSATRSVGNATEAGASAYGSDPVPAADDALILRIVDGDPSSNRKVELTKADENAYGIGMLHLKLTQEDTAGNVTTLEEHIVSMDPESTDDMGSPAFIETVLESRSARLRATVANSGLAVNFIDPTAFTGASNGALGDITADDLKKAIAVLSNAVERYNAVVGLGIYEAEAIKDLIGICNARRIGGFFDINPRLTHAEGLQAMADLGISEPRASFTHFPYSSVDGTYKNRVMFGISGIHFAAKAKGVAKTSPTGGWHYTPAGEERAIISRAALRPADGIGEPDYEAMYAKRLNKVGVSNAGLLFIDDSLTSSVKENYLRFEQQVSVADAMSRDFVNLSNQIKHSPDGITHETLMNGMTDIANDYVSVGALVKPRNPEDGDEPFRIFVEQVEIDLWRVRWEICVTGSGRRFAGEPVLIR